MGDPKSVWAKSFLLRVVTYSVFTSLEVSGFAAWLWRDELVNGRFDAYGVVLAIAGVAFLLSYYLLGGVLWVANALIELLSPSPKESEP